MQLRIGGSTDARDLVIPVVSLVSTEARDESAGTHGGSVALAHGVGERNQIVLIGIGGF
jgi:hypothetical protein